MSSDWKDLISKPHSSLPFDKISVWLVTIAVLGCVVIWSFFMERRIWSDDYGLFNPIYTYVVNGIISYPTYGQFHFMTVHPPTDYVFKGFLIKLGIPIPYAESLPAFLLLLAIIVLILKSRFSTQAKMGFLFGAVAGSMIPWETPFSGEGLGATRPDLEFALAIFGGLVALESGRISNWDLRRLSVGAFLLTYASAIHYPAMLSWTGILVYFAFALKSNWNQGKRVATVLLLGALVFAIPFLLLWAIPTFSDIVAWFMSPGIKPVSIPMDAILAHIQITKSLPNYLSGDVIGSVLFFPLQTGIPVVLISTVVLILRKETRLMALAALPTQLFLLLVIARVQDGWFYDYLEFMLYCSAIAIVAIVAIGFFVEKVNKFHPKLNALANPLIAIGLIILLVFGTGLQYAELNAQPRPDELTIARAAGKSILGQHAFVGADLARSYIFGESYWVMVNPYILWPSHINFDIPSFLSKFDAIGVDYANSNVDYSTFNNKSLVSYYVDHTMDLRGFYFSSRHNPTLSYLLLSTHRPTTLQGYGLLKDWTVMHFEEKDSGNYVFAAIICNEHDYSPNGNQTNPPTGNFSTTAVPSLFSNTYLLPRLSGPPKDVIVFVSTDSQYNSHRQVIASKCSIRDEIRVTGQQEDYNDLLKVLHNDSPIQFYGDVESALKAKQFPQAAKPEIGTAPPQHLQVMAIVFESMVAVILGFALWRWSKSKRKI